MFTQKKPWLLVAVAAAATAALWYIRTSDLFSLSGRVDGDMERKATWLVLVPGPLIIDSPGGKADSAFNISKILYKSRKSIFIRGECSSACAEYFIPSASKVYASRDAAIGYHITDFLDDDKGLAASGLPSCSSERRLWLKKLYQHRSLDPNFYKQTVGELGIQTLPSSLVRQNESCYTQAFTYTRAEIWYPTSGDLKKYLNLDIGHPICADSEKCGQRLLDTLPYAKARVLGQAVVIGRRLYALQADPDGSD